MSDNIWTALAAPLPSLAIEWRIDSKPTARDRKYFARFVPYVTTQYVRERLDAVVPGMWSSRIEREPDAADKDGVAIYTYKCSLSVVGGDDAPVVREDVGEGDSPKVAATDAFKRAAMRFGIAHELYSFGPNWVQVDSDSKYAKAVEDPQAAYERRKDSGQVAHPAVTPRVTTPAQGLTAEDKQAYREAVAAPKAVPPDVVPACPKCSGVMWDNRVGKKNPRAPDFKCRDKSCDGVIWPERGSVAAAKPAIVQADDEPYAAALSRAADEDSPLPF